MKEKWIDRIELGRAYLGTILIFTDYYFGFPVINKIYHFLTKW